ncbi:galanin receptor type 1-like [Actinia tenebrosa]|uniref:Galanin receptor type 1-like n=1 Tax=Actinia tenebrosa TaxID=6105 RepID=A0A6P8HRP9_ACTTE|nr:galanin receptor type 1-like [Actinia tenebrosa]
MKGTSSEQAIANNTRLWFSKSFNPVLSVVFIELNYLLVVASISTIASISVERLWAVVFPIHHRNAVPKLYIIFIAVPCLIAATNSCLGLLASSGIITWYPFLYFDQVKMLTICVTIFGCYLGIFMKQKCRNITADSRRKTLRDKKLAGTLFLVTFASFITWFPVSVYYQVLTYQEKISYTATSSNKTFFFLIALSICNSGVNVVVYMFRMPEFKRAAKSIICKYCSRSTRRINVQNISRRKPPSRNVNALARMDCECIVISSCPDQLRFDISGSNVLTHCQEAVTSSGVKGQDGQARESSVIPVTDVTGTSYKHSDTPSEKEDLNSFDE